MQTPETNEASQTQTSLSEFHSVHLQEDLCKGCTICVTGCPAEAIRVRNGKAHIIEVKCIDCGDCIRHCPSHAKYSFYSHIDELDAYTKTAALLSPAIYGQFNIHYSKAQIHAAFRALGFSDVFDVSEDALRITKATAKFILEHKHINEPFISCSCPTIIKLIQVRFPSLIDNILPFIPPIELCARRAKRELEASANANDTPCAAKITIARTPVGYEKTALTGAFAFDKLYLPLVTALRKMRDEEKKQGTALSFYDDASQGISWERQFGEADILPIVLNKWKVKIQVKQVHAKLKVQLNRKCGSSLIGFRLRA